MCLLNLLVLVQNDIFPILANIGRFFCNHSTITSYLYGGPQGHEVYTIRWSVGLRWSGRNEGATYGLFSAMSPKLG